MDELTLDRHHMILGLADTAARLAQVGNDVGSSALQNMFNDMAGRMLDRAQELLEGK